MAKRTPPDEKPQPLPPDAPYEDPATGAICDPAKIVEQNPQWLTMTRPGSPLAVGRSPLYVPHGTDPRLYPTNLPDNQWGRAVKCNCENASDYDPDRNGVVEIKAVYFLVFPTERENRESGEMEPRLATSLIDAEGRHITTTSEVVRKRLLSVIGHEGWGPWPDGVLLQVRSRRSKAGDTTYHELVRVLERDQQSDGAG